VSESGNIVAETATRIFADLADPQTINRGGDGAWKAPLWQALAEAGLTLAWVPQALGGTGAGLDDGFDIIGVAGRFAAPVPLAETLLAGWLLSRAGIASPAGAMAVAPSHPDNRMTLNSDGTLSGCARSVSFAREARHLAVCATAHGKTSIALVEAGACRIADGRNLAGDALDAVTFDRAKPILLACAPADFDLTSLMLMGAAVRAVATAAALESVLSLSVRYANERVAFERPIGKFQAVQHNLARLAGEVAAAMTAAGSAAETIAHAGAFDDAVFLEVAAAKIRCAEAATEGSAIAHQIHGAIGFTREHILHRFTLRLLAWRDDFGNESHWAAALGNRVAARGAEEFWPLLASR
jgi:alkylation response protein AidB-like acyl-CoA dehydrogenase